ncbi:MAG: DMT family transporter [Candidatus Thorarchaeota archaeon]
MIIIYILLTFMIILWSFSFVLVDIAVEFISPMTIALNRFLIASIVFLIVDLSLLVKNKIFKSTNVKRINNRKLTRKEWIYLLIASFCGISLFFYSQYTAIELIGPSLPALFVCLLAPIIITTLALIFFKEKLTKIKLIGFLIATLGGFLLVTGGDLNSLNPETPYFIGYIFALLTPFLWALYSILTKRVIQKQSNFKILKIVAYFGTLELLIFSFMNNELIIYFQNFFNIVILISGVYLGIGCYIIGYYIWQKSQKELQSSKGASFLYLEPFLTLIFSYLLSRNEIIIIGNLIGGLIVLVALIIINYK